MKKNYLTGVFVAVLLVMLTVSSPLNVNATPAINYYFVKSWGGEADQFLNPQGVAWGKDGAFFVANRDLHRITGVSTRNNTYWTWGYQGFSYPLEFQKTFGVAVDANGYVYSTDGNWNITKTTPQGELVGSWYLMGALAIDVDPYGNVYVLKNSVSSGSEGYVNKYTNEGQFIASWGYAGSGVGNLWFPRDIATSNQYVYIADTENNRIQKYTHDGAFVTSWGSEGVANGQFNNPQGIAVDQIGNVYVADTRNQRVQVFTSNGTFIRKWGGTNGTEPGEFKYPVGISVNENGIVLVSDSQNNRIQMFQSDGLYLGQFGAQKNYSSSDNFTGPIAVDSSHNIYVADNVKYKVQKFNSNMELIKTWDSHYYGRTWGMALDPGGYIYTTGGSKIQKYDLQGNWIKEWVGCVDGSPRSIAVDSNHQVFVNCYGADTRKFDENGNLLLSWTRPDGGWISNDGIAVDGSNNVYVSDNNFSSIYQFDNNGNFIKTIGSFIGATGLAAYSDLIYIADQFNYRLNVYNSNGDFVTSWGGRGVEPGEFVWPAYVATYQAQDVYVVDGNGLYQYSTSREPGFVNGSFEEVTQLSDWAFGGALEVLQGGVASEGQYSLQLGSSVSQTEQGEGFGWAHQTIYVDPNMSQPVLKFDYRMVANDIMDYSDFLVQIQDGTGRNYLDTVIRDGYNPCTPGVAPRPATDLGWRSAGMNLSKYKGEYIRVVFASRNLWPISWGIWTYVDNVRVEDVGPVPTPPGDEMVYLPLITRQRACDALPQYADSYLNVQRESLLPNLP